MTAYISLLRGVNVGGSKMVSMDMLCDLYGGLGFTRIRTYLNSGNVVFESPLDDPSRLTSQIEGTIQHIYGFHVDVFIRQAVDLQRIIVHNPFKEEAKRDASRLHVSFLLHEPPAGAWDRLDVPPEIPERLARGEMAVYLYYPNGAGKTKLPTSYLEKVLGVPMTNRNWNTVNALYKLAAEI